MFGSIQWADADRAQQLVTEEIPVKVAADEKYKNAQANSDKQNAGIEHDAAPRRVMTSLLKDDTELLEVEHATIERVADTHQPPLV